MFLFVFFLQKKSSKSNLLYCSSHHIKDEKNKTRRKENRLTKHNLIFIFMPAPNLVYRLEAI